MRRTTIFLLLAFLGFASMACQRYKGAVSFDADKTYLVSDGWNTFEVSWEGDIVPAADERSVEAISRGGYLKIKEGSWFKKKKLVLMAGPDGELRQKYYRGGRLRDFAPEGEQWLAEVLPRVLAKTSVGAVHRLDSWYLQGGMEEALRRIVKLQNGGVRQEYFALLVARPELSTTERQMLMQRSADIFQSDQFRASFLSDHKTWFLASADEQKAFQAACEAFRSDFYRYQLLREVLAQGGFEASHSRAWLEIASGIDSDHYRAGVLEDLLQSKKLDGLGLEQLLALTAAMSSDHYKSQVFLSLVDGYDLQTDYFQAFCSVLAGFDSDHYRTKVAVPALKRERAEVKRALLLNSLGRSMSSDHYRSEVLTVAARSSALGPEAFQAWLETARGISSEHYRAKVLESLWKHQSLPSVQRDMLFRAFPEQMAAVAG